MEYLSKKRYDEIAAESLHLTDAVVAVSGSFIHFIGNKQFLLLIMTQCLDGDLHQTGKLSDF